jgi:kynurenine formamidase
LAGWHRRGGIVARGVLIDYVAYAQRHGITYRPTERHEISIENLERAADEQGLRFRQGDVLIVRSGLVKWLKEHSGYQEPARWAHDKNKCSVGVAASEDAVEWLWNRHFAAVAGDALAWESVPYPADRPCELFPPELELVADITLSALHQHLIPMFGMPIGELWDLEELASMCERLGRYSFLLTSIPLHVPGGVASPPNAIAIF